MTIKKLFFIIVLTSIQLVIFAQADNEIRLVGVYQGNALFIQNPYDADLKEFCVERIFINTKEYQFNDQVSAIIIDFKEFSLYQPINLMIQSKRADCNPIIINPESIKFHTHFNFLEMRITDSSFIWKTKGEVGMGSFFLEKLQDGLWVEIKKEKALAIYAGSDYEVLIKLEEGTNKFRIKYIFPKKSRFSHIYSEELEYQFYREPITYSPKESSKLIRFSRYTPFEIYDSQGELLKEGQATEVNISRLYKGDYVIYFDGKDPGTFTKQ